MTIGSAVSRNDYTGAGNEDEYDFTFRIFSASDLLVTVRDTDDAEETLALTTDYTVDGVGDAAGGTITLVAGNLTSGYVLTIRRVRDVKQETDIRNQGSFFPETHEDAFDHLVMIDQQQQDEIDRSIRLPETFSSEDFDTQLPIPVAERLIGWNSDGDGLSNYAAAGNLSVSAFMESVLDDTTATAARTTLDAQQEITSLTVDTAPAIGDSVHTYDVSALASKRAYVPALVSASLQKAGASYNLGGAQGSDATKFKITSANGTALSAINPAYVCLPSTTAGQLAVFAVTADVSIDLTGAHWGLDTLGNRTDIELRVIAINDAGTLKWGIANKGGLRTVVDTDSTATAASVTTQAKVLVNSALTAGTWGSAEVMWFYADYTDVGDEWAVQNSAGDINIGVPAPVTTDWASYSSTCGLTGGTNVVTALWRRAGETLHVKIDTTFSTVFTGGSPTFTLPSGLVMDVSKMPGTEVTDVTPTLGFSRHYDVGSDMYAGDVVYKTTSSVLARVNLDDLGASSASVSIAGSVATTVPFTWANNDRMYLEFSAPIVGWSVV